MGTAGQPRLVMLPLHVPQLNERYLYEATCAVFDPDKLQWTRQGLRSQQLQETVECSVANGNGVAIPFTVFYMPMPVPEEDEPVNVGIMVVAIIVFFLCLGAVAYSNSKKGADKVVPEDDSTAPAEKAEESASAVQEVPEASPVVPDPVAPAELAEASVPVEPQASVPRSGPGNEAIEAHFQDWEKEVSPKSTTTPAAGPGPPEVASSPAPGQSLEVRVDTNDSAPSNLPRHPEDGASRTVFLDIFPPAKSAIYLDSLMYQKDKFFVKLLECLPGTKSTGATLWFLPPRFVSLAWGFVTLML
eukprot:s262_g20.t1